MQVFPWKDPSPPREFQWDKTHRPDNKDLGRWYIMWGRSKSIFNLLSVASCTSTMETPRVYFSSTKPIHTESDRTHYYCISGKMIEGAVVDPRGNSP